MDSQALVSDACFVDPFSIYHALRPRSPVRYAWPKGAGVLVTEGDSIDIYALLSYEHVNLAVRDPETFSSDLRERMTTPPMVMLHDDPPRHVRFRRLANKAFTPQRINALRPWLAEATNDLLDARTPGGNVMQELAIPLPVRAIARILGVPEEHYKEFKKWSDAFSAGNTQPSHAKSLDNMVDYLKEIAAKRREAPLDDLISAIVHADGEPLEEWEVVGFLILLLVAGNETTTHLIGNMLHMLAQRPDLWRLLQNDKTRIPTFVQESLRMLGPAQRLTRVVARPVQMGDTLLQPGQLVHVYFAAANRDPAAFDNPDEFVWDRPARHVAFGRGIHTCLGQVLAEVEADVVLSACVERFASIKLGAKPSTYQRGTRLFYGFETLFLHFGEK